ncbi:MAG: hypothetical protein WCP20_11855, partial [Desulfuromonadales bacterium]
PACRVVWGLGEKNPRLPDFECVGSAPYLSDWGQRSGVYPTLLRNKSLLVCMTGSFEFQFSATADWFFFEAIGEVS